MFHLYEVPHFLSHIILFVQREAICLSLNLSLEYAICSCFSSNTPLFKEFRNVFLSPCFLQLQYWFVPSTCFKIRFHAYWTYVHHPGPIVQVHLEVTHTHLTVSSQVPTGFILSRSQLTRLSQTEHSISQEPWIQWPKALTSLRQTCKSLSAAFFPL